MSNDKSTLQDVIGPSTNRRGLIIRRITLVVLAVVVAAGASGWLGVHAETVTTNGYGGYRLTLTYP